MEYLLISFFSLIIGALLVFASKPENKFKIVGIFSFISLVTALVPVIPSINYGKDYGVSIPYAAFMQPFKLYIDPLSAFVILILMSFTALYVIDLLKNKKYSSAFFRPEILMLMAAFIVLGLSVANVVYFSLACIAISGLLLWLAGDSEQGKSKTIAIFFFNSAVLTAVMLLSVYSNSFNFPDVSHYLKIDVNLNGAVFGLIFAGFALPAILSEYLIDTASVFKNSGCTEVYIIQALLYIFCVYGFFRFISFGVVPAQWFFWLAFVLLVLFAGFKTYELFKTAGVLKVNSYMRTALIVLSTVSVLLGILGQVFKVPLVSILGYMAAIMFFINIVFTGYIFQSEIKNSIETNPDLNLYSKDFISTGLKRFMPLCLCNYSGLPGTFGFYAWGLLLAACGFGCFTQYPMLKAVSVLTLIFALLLFVSFILKTIFLSKKYLCAETEAIKVPFLKLNLILALLIIFCGLLPQSLLKIVTVPVSFLSGGTQYSALFFAIQAFIGRVGIFLAGVAILMALYVVIKRLILKLKNRTPNG